MECPIPKQAYFFCFPSVSASINATNGSSMFSVLVEFALIEVKNERD